MGFSCDCDDGPEFFKASEFVCRKERKCCECRQEMRIGDVYERVVGEWGGVFHTFTTCERCADLREAFSSLGYCWSYGSFLIDYSDWLAHEELEQPTWLTELFDKWRAEKAAARATR